MDLLENSPTVNYGALAKLFRVTEEEVRERFSTGYENQPVPIEKTTESLKNPGVDDAIKKHKLNDSIKKRHRYWWV